MDELMRFEESERCRRILRVEVVGTSTGEVCRVPHTSDVFDFEVKLRKEE